jgi:hypothetical protein
MLKLSKILTNNSKKVIVDLINLSNYGRLLEDHVELIFSSSDTVTQTVSVNALLTSTTGVTGQYKGSTTVQYDRPLVNTMLPGNPVFVVVINYPFTFKQLKDNLFNSYGLVLENDDISKYKNSIETVTNNFEFNSSYPEIMDDKIRLYVNPKSPRFAPSEEPSFVIKPVNSLGHDIDLLIPSTTLHPLHSLDNL